MYRIMIVFLITLSVAGCVSRSTNLVHPGTKETRWCEASGWGWFGAPHAARMHNRCVNRLKEQGYTVGGSHTPGETKSLPAPPEGLVWNERLAKTAFKERRLSEAQYEVIITEVVERYQSTVRSARARLKAGEISEAEYKAIKRQAEIDYEG